MMVLGTSIVMGEFADEGAGAPGGKRWGEAKAESDARQGTAGRCTRRGSLTGGHGQLPDKLKALN
jgi:hypothetical protein